jgi:hypothetical protein
MARTDIMLNEAGDLDIIDGDFVVSESDAQNVELLLSATKGSLRQYPEMGVGLANYVKKQNTSTAEMRRSIEVNLKADGYRVNKLKVDSEGEFIVDYEPNYES